MISVIIPAYNYGHLLAETLESLLRQTYTEWEALIIDNASTDNTREIVDNFIKKDPRFRYFLNNKGGISASRNLGIINAKGDFIQFLDADDLLQPKKFESDLNAFTQNPEADAVYSTSLYFEHPNSAVFYPTYKLTQEVITPFKIYPDTERKELISKICTGNIFTINSILYKKNASETLDLFDEDLKHNEDWYFWFNFILKGRKFSYYDAPESKSLIRIHRTSISQNEFKMLIGGIYVCEKMLKRPELSAQRDALTKKAIAHKLRILKILSDDLSKKEDITEKINDLSVVLGQNEIQKMLKLIKAKKINALKLFLKFSMLKYKLKSA